MVTKTQEEWDMLSPAEKKAHQANEEKVVFGVDFKKTRRGEPVEQGIGAPGHETNNHFTALERSEGKEAADAARAEARKRKET